MHRSVQTIGIVNEVKTKLKSALFTVLLCDIISSKFKNKEFKSLSFRNYLCNIFVLAIGSCNDVCCNAGVVCALCADFEITCYCTYVDNIYNNNPPNPGYFTFYYLDAFDGPATCGPTTPGISVNPNNGRAVSSNAFMCP